MTWDSSPRGKRRTSRVTHTQNVSFSKAVRIGDVVPPKGEYRVQHTVEGDEHVMVFKQINSSKPVTAKAKCQLVPRPKKADQTAYLYQTKGSEEIVLQEVIFKGDTAKHVL